MKKTLILLPVIALTACDKPTTSIELECSMNKDWQKPVSMLRTGEDYKNQVPVLVDVKAYNDHAVLVVNGKESTFYKSREEKSMGEFGRVFVDYEGIFPDTDRLATFSFYGDIGSKTILQFDLYFDGEYKLHDGKRFNMGHSCTPTKKEYIGDNWSANAPWNHDYKMPNKIEKCITEIVNKVICNSDKCDRLILSDEKNKTLSQEEALMLSKNWNYNDMKYYRNDGKLEEHEKDACEVLERIKQFVIDNGLDNHDYKAIQKAMDDCGDECRPVLVTGEMGDFLIKLPATDELRKIANKQKNAKFLSVFNPNSYAKAGYCLLNIIPYSTMEKLGWENKDCHYRLYCGAPEFMDYDQYYAVEVCN